MNIGAPQKSRKAKFGQAARFKVVLEAKILAK